MYILPAAIDMLARTHPYGKVEIKDCLVQCLPKDH